MLVRIVAVGSFFFHIILARDRDNLVQFSSAVSEFLTGVTGATLVDPGKQSVVLRSSPQDSLSSMMPLLTAKKEQYGKFFESRRKK